MTKYLQKEQYIKDLQPGKPVASLFVIAQARQGQARNGPFWALTLADATGRADAKIWSPVSQEYPSLAAGMVARVEGSAQTYKDQVQVNVDRLTIIDPACQGLDMSRLVPSSSVPPQALHGRLLDLCAQHLTHPGWERLARVVLTDPEVTRRLLAAPGAKNVHHAYMGGLLEHTLSVAGLCMKFCDHYPELDRQALLCAALFHDLGKAWELSGGLVNDYTDEGRLIGHISLGMEVLAPFLADAGLEPGLVLHLKHIILSHHGEYAFGSPRRPKTAEAMALHYADNLDAKMNQVAGVFADMAAAGQGAEVFGVGNGVDNGTHDGTENGPENGAQGEANAMIAGQWSPFQRTLERYLYNPNRTPQVAQWQPPQSAHRPAYASGGAEAKVALPSAPEEEGAFSPVPEDGAATPPWEDVPLEAYADAACADNGGEGDGGSGLTADDAVAARAFFSTPPWEEVPEGGSGAGSGPDAADSGETRRMRKIRVDQCSLLSKG